MKPIELVLTFRGINVPTALITSKPACGITVGQLIDGREQKSNFLLFAYQNGDVWKTDFLHKELGKVRLTLVSNSFRCFRDVVIDDDVLAKGVLHVEFSREDCHRKWIPVFLKRWWWKLCDYRARRRDDPRRDHHALSQYRRHFRRGPVGKWLSDSELTLYGTSIEFRPNFTGTITNWGSEREESPREFRWKCVGDYAIEVQPTEGKLDPTEWGVLRYDFKVSRNPYGHRQLLMYMPDKPKHVENGPGFWHSCEPVVLNERL